MTLQLSFSKYENEMLPNFREKTNMAESTEDIKKFFGYTAKELFSAVFRDKFAVEPDDVMLTAGEEPYYTLSDRLMGLKEFTEVWNGSDLPHVTGRLARSAMHHYKHLAKKPEKTNSKIRM
jgi:hypothetical protein